jgi:signal transduction histidine kinase
MRRLGIVHPDPLKQDHARRLKDGWPPARGDPIGLPRAVRSRSSEFIPHVTDEMLLEVSRSAENLRDLRALAIGSLLVVPLIARDHVIGAITFVSEDTGEPYADADLELAEDLAARCALTLDNARLLRDAEEARAEAEHARARATQMNERLVVASIRQQELADEAREANLAKSQFLATMSHEIRTPVNAVIGYADLLELEIAGPLTSGQREYLDRMLASCRHLIGLIEDILDLAKVETGGMALKREAEPVDESIAAALVLIQPQATAARLSVMTTCPERWRSCSSDPGDSPQQRGEVHRARRKRERALRRHQRPGCGCEAPGRWPVGLHLLGGYRSRNIARGGGDGVPAVRSGRSGEDPRAGWCRPGTRYCPGTRAADGW